MKVLTISNTICSLDMKNPGLGPKSIQSFQISANCVTNSRKRPNPIAAGELFLSPGSPSFRPFTPWYVFLELGGFYSDSTVK